jgi:hypothetical protein
MLVPERNELAAVTARDSARADSKGSPSPMGYLTKRDPIESFLAEQSIDHQTLYQDAHSTETDNDSDRAWTTEPSKWNDLDFGRQLS